MKLRSHIDFPAFAFQKYNSQKELMGIATISALFDIGMDGALRLCANQPGIQLSDEYLSADPSRPHLYRTSDFAPFRPATDVTALARAIAPGDRPQSSWLVGLMIGDKHLTLRVHGPRQWYWTEAKGWQLTTAQPTLTLPLNYYASSGGRLAVHEDKPGAGEVDIWNPVGPGVLTPDTPRDVSIAAPQIEHVDQPIVDPYHAYLPQGYAPIAPVWRFRQQFTGTYDETWIQTQHPFLPPDFDPRFYNVAHPALQFEPYLRGDELIRAVNLFPGRPDISFYMPHLAFGMVATHRSGIAVKTPMVLDGVHLDFLGEVPQMRVTWRASLPWHDGIKTLDVGPLEFESKPDTWSNG